MKNCDLGLENAAIFQILYCSSRNQLSFLFYCLLWNVLDLVVPLINTQANREFDEFLSLVYISENNVVTFVGTVEENLYSGGGSGWCMDIFTNHSKPCSIGQKHSHCLANYSNSAVIGYPGSQTTVETTDNRMSMEASPQKSLCLFLFQRQFRVHRWLATEENYNLWFEAIPFVGRRTVLSTILAWFSRKSAHIRTWGPFLDSPGNFSGS